MKSNNLFIATIILAVAAILMSMLNLLKDNQFFQSAAVQIVIVVLAVCLIVLGLTLLYKGLKARQNQRL